MLSKSQARLFFIVFTAGFSLVFLWLTIDTVRSVPAQSNQNAMSAEVIRGKHIWDNKNCMGCHTLLGEGAYYAPELTKIAKKKSAAYLKRFLKDPAAMYPGQRRMVKYDFSDAEIDAVIAFLTWISNIDTNGFPADPDLKPKETGTAKADPFAGAPPIATALCTSCHSLGGVGQNVGPAFDGVGSRFTADELDRWLADPQAIKPGTAMPNLNLSDSDRKALTTWLGSLKK